MDGASSGTVLVADDQDELRRMLVPALQRHDFGVLEATTGEMAMDFLQTQPVDVLVLDVGLPAMSRQAMGVGIQYYALRTGCRLVAEGVETAEEANTLRSFGVDLAQGYLFGRPERLPN